MTKTQSGVTMLNTTDDVMSATRVTIWKELMRQKEEDGLDGSEHLPRSTIRQIRTRVKRERIAERKRSKKMMKRRLTSMDFSSRQ